MCERYMDYSKGNKDLFICCEPYAIVTMKQDLRISDSYHNRKFELLEGDVLLYISGERAAQRSPFSLASDFRFPFKDYPNMKIIFVDLFGKYEDDFFDERIYIDGQYETKLMKMITMEKYIKDNYDINISDIKQVKI